MTFIVNEDIASMQVAMNDPFAMQVFQSKRCLKKLYTTASFGTSCPTASTQLADPRGPFL